ncbi:MAG: IS1634 family transposase [Anaerolineae bacterium]
MIERLHEVEFETRTIGPLVLTTPVFQRLDFRGTVNCYCPIAEQADMDYGLVAELVSQSRLSDPRALYDLVDWAERYAIPDLYPEIERADQLNDDRIGRMLDAVYDQRALIWGELVTNAARFYQVDLHRLHADTMAMTFAGLFAEQATEEGVPRLEPGYNPQGEWVQQLKLFALVAGDGGLPVWFNALDGGTGDSTTYVPEFAAFCEHARLSNFLPLEEVVLIGDGKMPTKENQLAWLRLGLGYIGPMTMQDHHRQALRELLAAGQTWEELPYVAQREVDKKPEERTVYRGLGHTVEVTDPEDPTRKWSVRHLYIHSSALAKREATRRQNEMQAIEAELQRIQGLVNKYDYKTPEIIVQRVQKKAFKKRRAQKYFTIEVLNHSHRPEAPLELRYCVDREQVRRDAELDGVYLLVAGGPATALSDAEILTEWKGQHKAERCFRLVNQVFLVAPLFVKTPRRIAALVFLIMVGALIAGLIERQVRRVLAKLQQPIQGLMPERRDTLRPRVQRLFKAFADYSLVQVRNAQGQVMETRFARLNPVQEQILKVLGLPQPAEIFARPALA